MKFLLEFFYGISNNYGLAIILLSMVVNMFLLPIYYLADKYKNKNKSIQESMKKEIDLIKKHYKGKERHYYIKTIYRRYNYHPISSIKASIGFLIQIPFFFSAFVLLSDYAPFSNVPFLMLSDLSSPDGLLFGMNLLPFIMSLINLASAFIYTSNLDKSEKIQLYSMTLIFLVLLYSSSSALLLYWSFNNLFSLLKNYAQKKTNLDKFNELIIFYVSYPFKNNKLFKDIYLQSIILFFGIIFIYRAIPLASSDTGMYMANYSFVAFNLIIFFIISISLFYLIYFFMPPKIKYVFKVTFTFLALSSLLYSFIIPYEFPILQALEMPSFYTPTFYTENKIMVKAASYSCFILLFFIFDKIKKSILPVLLFSNIFLMGNSIIVGFNPKVIDSLVMKEEININPKILENKLKNAYSFSKESNVIVIMMDMFQGNIFSDIISKYPIIKKELEGFTYYPNTLSYGDTTWISMPVLVGGKKFKIQNYNANKNKSLSFHENSYLSNIKMVKQYNHSYTTYNPQYVGCEFFANYKNSICLNASEVKIGNDLKKDLIKIKQNNQSTTYLQTAIIFSKISFVTSMPHHLKSFVAKRIDHFKGLAYYFSHVRYYSQLKNMSEFANTNSKQKTFKLIQNPITHKKWSINNECKVVAKNIKGYNGLFNSSYCSIKLLITFFNKLKYLGIYDKTKIIIVSDHGAKNIKSKNFNAKISDASALLLVKDFNERGNLTISNKFLSNIDIYGIALSGASNDKNMNLDMIKNYKERELLFVKKVSPSNSYNISKAFKVKNNLFKYENWEELSDKKINNLYR